MDITVANVSVVVTAQQHNPAILHPSFLKAQGIVPQDWQDDPQTISTPVLARVGFTNGVEFVVQPQRLKITQLGSEENNLRNSCLPNITKNYVLALPHVKHTAIGINVSCFIKDSSPGSTLTEQFITKGTWNDKTLKPESCEVKLTYGVPEAHLQLSCQPGELRIDPSAPVPGIVLNGNYHTDLPDGRVIETIEESLSRFQERYDHFFELLNQIFGN
ncbi:hypothetical protein ACFL1X_09920 [Candidatus Hydrogenedentota bacterium]